MAFNNRKLKPCPFCGTENSYSHGEVRMHESMGKSYYVICENSDCSIQPRTRYYTYAKDCIEVWNKRK